VGKRDHHKQGRLEKLSLPSQGSDEVSSRAFDPWHCATVASTRQKRKTELHHRDRHRGVGGGKRKIVSFRRRLRRRFVLPVRQQDETLGGHGFLMVRSARLWGSYQLSSPWLWSYS
jgi:hypothetical protein